MAVFFQYRIPDSRSAATKLELEAKKTESAQGNKLRFFQSSPGRGPGAPVRTGGIVGGGSVGGGGGAGGGSSVGGGVRECGTAPPTDTHMQTETCRLDFTFQFGSDGDA